LHRGWRVLLRHAGRVGCSGSTRWSAETRGGRLGDDEALCLRGERARGDGRTIEWREGRELACTADWASVALEEY
jgi:hypothetical protein